MARKKPTVYLREDFSGRSLPIEVELSTGDRHHLLDVLRLRNGESIQVFDGKGASFSGSLVRTKADKYAGLRILEPQAPAQTQLDESFYSMVFQAPPRAGHMDPFIRALAEIGTSAFTPIQAERSVVQDVGERRIERWQRMADESAKQSGRPVPMRIDEALPFTGALEQRSRFDLGFILSPNPKHLLPMADLSARLANYHGDTKPRIALLVGPEGGFTQAEEEAAVAQGFEALCLNAFTLRSETAATVAMAIFHFMLL